MSVLFEKSISSRRMRRHMMYLIVTALSGGFISMPAEGRPVTPMVSYKDIARPELIVQYKLAYAAAGFDFVSETTGYGGYSTLVEFKFRVPEFPHKTEGKVAISFSVPHLSENDACSPCNVHFFGFGGFGDDYAPAQAAVARARLASADAQAGARIRQKLGISLPDQR